MLNFFLISNMYPTKDSPGYGSFVKNVCEGLSEYGVSVKYKSVIKGRSKSFLKKIYKYTKFYLSIFCNFFKKYDFIYIHFPNQSIPILKLLYKFKQPPIIVNYHGEDLIYNTTGYSNKLGRMTEEFCRKYASSIVVPSSYFKNIVLSRKIGVDKQIIISPSGGINKDYFYPKQSRVDSEVLHIGYVGRLEPEKGIYEFLEVCRILKERISFKATIIGYGSCQDYVLNFVKERNLNQFVEIINGLPQSDLGEYYRKFDLLIFCSSSKTGESLGLTGIEAMACGTPVVGSNMGGIATYVISGHNGYLIPIKDVDAIVKSIFSYYNLTEEKRKIMKNNAVDTGKHFFSSSVCAKLAIDIKESISL